MNHNDVPIFINNNNGCCLFKSADNFQENGAISCCNLTYRHSKTKCDYICVIINILICLTLISFLSYIINNCIQIENGSLNYQIGCSAYVQTTANYATSIQLTNNDNTQLNIYNTKYMFTYGENKEYGPVSCLQLNWIQSEIPEIFNHNNLYTIYVMNYYGKLTCSLNKINIDNSYSYVINSLMIIILSLYLFYNIYYIILRIKSPN